MTEPWNDQTPPELLAAGLEILVAETRVYRAFPVEEEGEVMEYLRKKWQEVN